MSQKLNGEDETVAVPRRTAEQLEEAARTLAEDIGNGRVYGGDREETEHNARQLERALSDVDEALTEAE